MRCQAGLYFIVPQIVSNEVCSYYNLECANSPKYLCNGVNFGPVRHLRVLSSDLLGHQSKIAFESLDSTTYIT